MLRVIEGIQFWLKSLGEHQAESSESQQALSEAMEAVVVKLDRLEGVIEALASKTAELHDSVGDLNYRLGSYLAEQAKKDASANTLRSEVREVDRRLKVLEGGSGQR